MEEQRVWFYNADGSDLIDPDGDFFKTLESCEGWYTCPRDADGKPIGPIVGYTADHPKGDGTKWVGTEYVNYSQADPWPAVNEFFAAGIVRHLLDRLARRPTLIVGAPWAGVKVSQEEARIMGVRHIFGEKKGDDIILGRYADKVLATDKIVIGEELVNNLSTTDKLIALLEQGGAEVIAISCAINRSFSPHRRELDLPDGRKIPIVGVIEQAMPQYHRDDPEVAEAIAKYGLIDKPKYVWSQLKAAMDAHR